MSRENQFLKIIKISAEEHAHSSNHLLFYFEAFEVWSNQAHWFILLKFAFTCQIRQQSVNLTFIHLCTRLTSEAHQLPQTLQRTI